MTLAETPTPGAMIPTLESVDDLRAIEAVPLARRNLPRTTWEIVDFAAQTFPDELANTWLPEPADPERGIRYTFLELRTAVQRYSNVYVGLGLGRTEAVAFLTPNVSTLLPALLAAQAVGIAAPINPAFDIDRLTTLIATTGTRIVVAAGPEFGEERWERLRSCARRLGLTALLALRPDGAVGTPPSLASMTGVSVLYLDDAAANVTSGMLGSTPPGPHDIAAYFHTGGTTGAPKVAAQTHGNEAFLAWDIATSVGFRLGDTILAGLPLFHVNGLLVTGLAPLLAGANSAWPGPLGWRDPSLLRNTWRLIERFGITAMSAVPTVYAQLATLEVDADISTLRTPVVGAAPLPAPVATSFRKQTGIALQEGYGLTEAGCASSFTLHGSSKPGSVGQRMPYQRVAAASFDSEGAITLLAPGIPGEIVISGPTVFAGYVKRANSRQWLDTSSIVDGWVRTGDLGSVDAEDRVWITGRSKDLIIRGGHNIDPTVIEEALLAHPHIRAAAAIGRPDLHAGEVPIAFVVVDADFDGDDLVAWAATRIDEPAARPLSVELLPELPLTAVGKPFKPALHAITVAALLRSRLKDLGEPGAAVWTRQTDNGLVITVDGSDEAVEMTKAALKDFASDAEVEHHVK